MGMTNRPKNHRPGDQGRYIGGRQGYLCPFRSALLSAVKKLVLPRGRQFSPSLIHLIMHIFILNLYSAKDNLLSIISKLQVMMNITHKKKNFKLIHLKKTNGDRLKKGVGVNIQLRKLFLFCVDTWNLFQLFEAIIEIILVNFQKQLTVRFSIMNIIWGKLSPQLTDGINQCHPNDYLEKCANSQST